MNKKILNFICLPSLITVALSGCARLPSNSGVVKKEALGIVEANAQTYDSYEQSDVLKSHGLFDYEVISASYLDYGIMIVKNKSGNLCLYNLIHDKFILNTNTNQFLEVSIDNRKTNGAIFFRVTYKDTVVMMDSLGRKLPEMRKDSFSHLELIKRGDEFYLKDKLISNRDSFYHLNGDRWESVNTIPAEQPIKPYLEIIDLTENSKFYGNHRISIEKLCGKKDYFVYLNDNNMMTTYYKDRAIASFALPDGSYFRSIVGQNIFYQMTNLVTDEDAVIQGKYYVDDTNQKYTVESYLIDMLSGKKQTLNYDYLIESGQTMKDSKGYYSVLNSFGYHIDSYNRLEEPSFMMFDEKLNLIGSTNGINIEDLVKTQNGYYDDNTKTVFDKNLAPISYLLFEEVKYLTKSDVFVVKQGNRFGLLDSSANVLFDLKYDQIVGNQTSENVLLLLGNQATLYNVPQKANVMSFNNREVASYAIDAHDFNTFLALLVKSDSFGFMDINGNLYEGNYKLDESTPYEHFTVNNSLDVRAQVVVVVKNGTEELEKFVFTIDAPEVVVVENTMEVSA